MNRRIRRFWQLFSIILMVSTTVGLQFVATVNAKKPEVNYNPVLGFTRILGTLGGAKYEIFMPDSWNEMLVIGCRGYHDEEPEIEEVAAHYLGLIFMTDENPEHFAFAWSTYGEGGWCIDTGVIRTHQLTEYVIENYNVQGKVLLHGVSMGGLIACLLGEKYPNLYDGVFDVCGVKDFASLYYHKKAITELPSNPTAIRAYMNGPPAYLPTSFTSTIPNNKLLQMQQNQISTLPLMEMECGGTPDTKPKAFERRSATCHADISIPVMSVVGQLDFGVPLFQVRMYYDAVEAAGCLDYYRSYIVEGGQHCDETVLEAALVYWEIFVDWVVDGGAPDPTPPPPWSP